MLPLFQLILIGFAIDDLIAGQTHALFKLVVVLVALIFVSVGRRLYDTRAYGNIRINVQEQLAKNKAKLPISVLNARIEMGRELVDFLEQNVPILAHRTRTVMQMHDAGECAYRLFCRHDPVGVC